LVHVQHRLRERFDADAAGTLVGVAHEVGRVGYGIVVAFLALLNTATVIDALLNALKLALMLLRLEHIQPVLLVLILEYSMLAGAVLLDVGGGRCGVVNRALLLVD